MNAKIQHCRDNAHQAAKEALHYLGRYQVLKSEGIRRRDAASHAWKARALFRMAKGYEAQAEELEAEAAKQPDMFMAAIMADEVDAFEVDQAEPFKLEPTPVIVGKQLAMLQTDDDRNQMDLFR